MVDMDMLLRRVVSQERFRMRFAAVMLFLAATATAQQVALMRTVLLHAWVREHRHLGMRLSAYWWSVIGEVLLRSLDAAASRDIIAARTARGVALGALHVLRHGSSRTFEL